MFEHNRKTVAPTKGTRSVPQELTRDTILSEATDIQIAIVSTQGLLRHSLYKLAEACCERVSAYSTVEQLKSAVGEVKAGSLLLLEARSDITVVKQAEDVAKHSSNWHLVLVVKDIGDVEMGDCIRAGARGCITQETPPEMIGRLLEMVSAGHIVWPSTPNVASGLNRRATDRVSRLHHRRPPDSQQKLALLSKREREVLDHIGHGLGNKRVAAMMSISDTTVRLHMRSIMRKLGAENRTQVAILALHAHQAEES